MASFEIKKLKEDLLAINKQFAEDFHTTASESRAKAMETMQPGTPAPPVDKVIGESFRKEFDGRAAGYRSKGYARIDQAKNDLRAAMNTAPSQDAVNAVSMLAHRTTFTQEDVNNLVDAYGSNYMTYEAIRDIAAKKEIYLPHHNYVEDAKDIDAATSMVSNMNLINAEQGMAASATALAFREYWTQRFD